MGVFRSSDLRNFASYNSYAEMVDIALEVNPLVCTPIERLPNEFVLACERLLVRLELSHCQASSLVAAASLPDLLLQSLSQHLVNVIDTILLFLHLRHNIPSCLHIRHMLGRNRR